MKTTLLTVVLSAALSMPVMADKNRCDILESLAETIMTKRQNGAKIGDMINGVSDKSEYVSKYTKAMIIRAYQEPRYPADVGTFQRDAIRAFSNAEYLKCALEKNQ